MSQPSNRIIALALLTGATTIIPNLAANAQSPKLISPQLGVEEPKREAPLTPIRATMKVSQTKSPALKPGMNPGAKMAPAKPPVDTPWKITGSVRLRVEDWNFFPTDLANGAYTFGAEQLRIAASRTTKKEDYFIELQETGLFGLPTRAIAPPPQGQLGHGANYYFSNSANQVDIFLKQAYVKIKDFSESGQFLKLGRWEFSDGMEVPSTDPSITWLKNNRIKDRLLGPFTFTHVGRSFDGIQYVKNTPKLNFTTLAALPTRGVFDLNGMDDLPSIKVGYVSATAPFTGKSPGEFRLFYLYYDDSRGLAPVDNRPAAARSADKNAIRIDNYGFHYVRSIPSGKDKIDVLLWGVGQVGKWASLDHLAYAFDGEVGYQFNKVSWKPWLRLGYYLGSGDGNSANGRHGTFIPILPTPRIYARYPVYNESNLEDSFISLILKPNSKLTIRPEFHALRLADRNDLYYSGGGAYNNSIFGFAGRPSNGSSDLGRLVDISADYQVNKATAVTLYMGYLNGGKVVNEFKSRDSVFGYAELNYKF